MKLILLPPVPFQSQYSDAFIVNVRHGRGLVLHLGFVMSHFLYSFFPHHTMSLLPVHISPKGDPFL